MRNRLLSVLALGVGVALASGCTNQPPGSAPAPVRTPAADSAAASPVELIDLWRVDGAEGESDDTWLRLDRSEFQLWRDCGIVGGSWRALGGLLLAEPNWASGTCVTDGIPDVPWLSAVAGFAEASSGIDLVAADGNTVASLSIDGAPAPRPDLAESYTEPPEVTEEVREWLAPPVPLPAELAPIDGGRLPGRWIPTGAAAATDAHAEFTADGRWTGSDGCNGGTGRWASGVDGVFLGTAGPSTLIACDGAPIPSWIDQAASAGLDGDTLVLVDGAGAELGRLTRA